MTTAFRFFRFLAVMSAASLAASPLMGQELLFSDNFERPDALDVDEIADGMAGPLAPLVYGEPYDRDEIESRIIGGALHTASGPGQTFVALDHNFVDDLILAGGGFRISAKVNPKTTDNEDDTNRFCSFGVGLTREESVIPIDNLDRHILENGSFVFAIENHGAYTFWDSVSSRIENLNNTTHVEEAVLGETTDFLEQVGLASTQDEYEVELHFQFPGFDSEDEVTVTAFVEGVQIDLDTTDGIEAEPSQRDSYTFTWDDSGQNYIALEGRAQTSSTYDDLVITTLRTPTDPQVLAPTRLKLGRLPTVPSTHDRIITVKNLGASKDLNIAAVTVEGTDEASFTVGAFPATVASGAEGEIALTFDSLGKIGGFRGLLKIETDDPDEPVLEVALSASVINALGPGAHYRLDDAADSIEIIDATGLERHAIPDGIVLGQAPIAGETGTAGAVSDGGQIKIDSSRLDDFEDFAVSVWLRANSLPANAAVFGRGEDGAPDFALLVSGGDVNWFVIDTPVLTTTTAPITVDTVHHVVFVHHAETGSAQIYVDGVEVASEEGLDPLELPDDLSLSTVFFGAFNGVLPFDGILDDIQLYFRTLSADEVAFMHANPGSFPEPEGDPDSDADGLIDLAEAELGTDPLNPDSDGDGLKDGDEVNAFETDPSEADTDGDGARDGAEQLFGGDPNDANTGLGNFLVRHLTAAPGTTLDSMDSLEELLIDPDIIADQTAVNASVINFADGGDGNFSDGNAVFPLFEEVSGRDDFGIQVTGTITITEPGVRAFGVNSDDGNRLFIDGQLVLEDPDTHGSQNAFGSVDLSEGEHKIELLYYERGGGAHVELFVNTSLGDVSSLDDGNFILLPASGEAASDSDGDGLFDFWEVLYFDNLDQTADADPDGDGLDNAGELANRGRPNVSDTDGDTLTDGEEVAGDPSTSPALSDTDSDGLKDGVELREGTNPRNPDTDGDSLEDGFEVLKGSDPKDAQSTGGLPRFVLLGQTTLEYHEISTLPTFHQQGGNNDQKNATFRMHVDFNPKADGEAEVLFESGGGTVGSSIVYEAGNKLVARSTGSGGLQLAVIEHTLTQAQLDGGLLELIWTFDIQDDQDQQSITLWLDRVVVGSDSQPLGADWTGSNGASFGAASGNFAGTGDNGSLSGIGFESGTIDLDRGLQFYADRLFESTGDAPPPVVVESTLAITDVTRDAGQLQVQFTSAAGNTYDVEFSPDLTSGSWVKAGTDIAGTGGDTVFAETDAARNALTQGYYRVRQQ